MSSMAFLLRIGLVLAAITAGPPIAVAEDGLTALTVIPGRHVSAGGVYGPGDVYANIPEKDDRGRDQIAMFREWNPDPLGDHEANLAALDPSLARTIRKAQADNLDLRFVIGSGRRDDALQRKAVAWGWSRARASAHRTGHAVDLWPLDRHGHVDFEPVIQGRLAAAVMRAAAQLHVPIRWGGGFRSFKDRDRSHFELVRS